MASMAETCALQAVAIELIRRDIRRGHQRDPAGKQRFHQAAQQHGIGDVRNKKLVEAEHVRFRLEPVGHNLQRIAFALQCS
jgi:hypothetical protein